jgi:hypothetical protein
VSEPLTRAEVAALPARIGTRELSRVAGASERSILELCRTGRLEAQLGIRAVKVAGRWQASTDQVLAALGITQPAAEPPPGPGPAVSEASADAFAAAVLRSLGERLLAAAGAITESEGRSVAGQQHIAGEGVRRGRLRSAGGGDGAA